jgi:hypothetical protein
MEGQSDVHNELEAESNSSLMPIDAKDASVIRYRSSTYGWKDKNITFQMALVSCQIQ